MCFTLVAQDEEAKSVLFESIIIEPDFKNVAALRTNMAAHNKKYHGEAGPHQSMVYNISTGPNAGKIVWMMGPLSWSDLDNRPSDDGHDEDWMGNVVSNMEGTGAVEYWELDTDLSIPSTGEVYPLIYIRYHNIRPDQGYRVNGLLKKISATMKSMEQVKSWSLYDNQLRQGSAGRHIASVSGMHKWAEMEDDWNFKEAFEKINGEGSITGFGKEMGDVFSDSWDEIWSYDAFMSGKEE